jgi:hypothetical protein
MPSRIKGGTILSTIGVIREVMDAARFQKLIDTCPVETQQLLRRTLMALEWVNVETWSPVLTTILERIAGGDEAKFRRFMRAVCKRDFSGMYRVYLQNATPASVLAKTATIWSAYFDSGTLTAGPLEPKNGSQQSLLELRNLESSSLIYLSAVHAYIEQILHMVDAKNPTVQRLREIRRDGRLSCDYIVSFE